MYVWINRYYIDKYDLTGIYVKLYYFNGQALLVKIGGGSYTTMGEKVEGGQQEPDLGLGAEPRKRNVQRKSLKDKNQMIFRGEGWEEESRIRYRENEEFLRARDHELLRQSRLVAHVALAAFIFGMLFIFSAVVLLALNFVSSGIANLGIGLVLKFFEVFCFRYSRTVNDRLDEAARKVEAEQAQARRIHELERIIDTFEDENKRLAAREQLFARMLQGDLPPDDPPSEKELPPGVDT